MSFSSNLRFIKHNLAVFLIVGGMLAGAAGAVGAWLWSEYRDLQQQKAQLEQRKFEVAEAQLQREREFAEAMNKRERDLAEAQLKREVELKNREYIVGQVESNYAEQERALKVRELELQRASEQTKRDQRVLIAEYGEKAAEMKLQALMSEFSALGIDLNSNPFCGDKTEQARYNTAKAKYDEIYSFAEANSLDDRYSNYLFHNQQSVQHFGCAKGQKGAFAP